MLVSEHLRRAMRRLFGAWMTARAPGRSSMRPIPDAVVEKYHRAVWALDTLGTAGDADRWALREIWQHASVVAMNASGEDGALIAQDIINTLNEQCERVIREAEKDHARAEWEKQRDFLLGSLRRVRRACALNDIGHLHFYKRMFEPFNIDLRHPTFQIGYHLWQGILRELKDAISFAQYRDKPPPNMRVEWLMQRMRQIIKAVEFSDLSGFQHYDPRKSPLHISQEEEGRILWEAVREEIARVIALSEAHGAAA